MDANTKDEPAGVAPPSSANSATGEASEDAIESSSDEDEAAAATAL